jgi:hypothetical protein
MKTLTVVRFVLSISIAATVLASCDASQPIGPPGVMQQAQAGGVRADGGKSWMKRSTSNALLYFDDDITNDTYVYEYPSGKQVGKLTGFHDPQGMCVDQKGDVYITNLQFGLLFEYAHGGTKPINIYERPGSSLTGCSVSGHRDVAATGGNEVCIWKGGISAHSPTCIDGDESIGCSGLSTFGYDHDGNLIGVGMMDTISGISTTACMIPAGETAMEKLSMSGIKFNFGARGTSWDGEYITLGGTKGNGDVVQPAKLSGTTLSGVGSEIRLDDCTEMPGSPFFFGKQNVTAASTTRATSVTVANPRCDKGVADVWNYPKSGDEPILRIRAEHDSGGDAVSIAK